MCSDFPRMEVSKLSSSLADRWAQRELWFLPLDGTELSWCSVGSGRLLVTLHFPSGEVKAGATRSPIRKMMERIHCRMGSWRKSPRAFSISKMRSDFEIRPDLCQAGFKLVT